MFFMSCTPEWLGVAVSNSARSARGAADVIAEQPLRSIDPQASAVYVTEVVRFINN
jgi:hypothetical protein